MDQNENAGALAGATGVSEASQDGRLTTSDDTNQPISVQAQAGAGKAECDLPITPKQEKQLPLRAQLIGSNTCSVEGVTATGTAPVLLLCRKLLAAGVDPSRSLEVYRGPTLALAVRGIGGAAKLTVREFYEGRSPTFCPAE